MSIYNSDFAQQYELKDHIGCGGYGFVMSAIQHATGREVAVKFIYKHKISRQQLVSVPMFVTSTSMTTTTETEHILIPKEIAILLRIKHHPTVIEYIDYFEDHRYYYLVMELFGTEWKSSDLEEKATKSIGSNESSANSPDSEINISEEPKDEDDRGDGLSDSKTISSSAESSSPVTPGTTTPTGFENSRLPEPLTMASIHDNPTNGQKERAPQRHKRRSSCDLFEYIETLLRHKHLQEKQRKQQQQRQQRVQACSNDNNSYTSSVLFTEAQIKSIFKQIIQCAYDLSKLGIYHRDIKDENIVIDSNLNVKLIDFGAAIQVPIIQTPIRQNETRRHHRRSHSCNTTINATAQKFPDYKVTKFLGTVTFASPEILLGLEYKPEPAEVWSLGVLLYTLLFGQPPFYSSNQVMRGQWSIPGLNTPLTTTGHDTGTSDAAFATTSFSKECLSLLQGLFKHHPEQRFSLEEILNHPWLKETA